MMSGSEISVFCGQKLGDKRDGVGVGTAFFRNKSPRRAGFIGSIGGLAGQVAV